MRIVREPLRRCFLSDRNCTPRTVAKYTDIDTATAHEFMVSAARKEAAERRGEIKEVKVSPDVLSGRSTAVLVNGCGDELVLYRQVWPGQPKPEPVPYKWMKGYKDTRNDFMDLIPWKEGDVIYVEGDNNKPRIACIRYITCERQSDGCLIEKFKVAYMRPDGSFARRGSHWVYPGPIQRGYQQAGHNV